MNALEPYIGAIKAVLLITILGGLFAWGYRLGSRHVQAKFDTFVAQTREVGEAAAREAAKTAELDRKNKEKADHDHQTALATLAADNRRLRDDRARRGFVPAAPAGAGRPDLACFDRAELEQALRRFDDEAAEIVGEGDAAAVGLDTAKEWAKGRRK